jgi:anhydro-N-acetylmuramic acid kinase
MSGSSLDGLDVVFAHFHDQAGVWRYEIRAAACYPYEEVWADRLRLATGLSAADYLVLHSDSGHYLGRKVIFFTEEKGIELQADLVASHGHTTFHLPGQGMTAQLGDGAALAAETNMAVVTDLRALDVALGGQGAPIVPVGEKLLFPDYDLFLNLGGIANISRHQGGGVTAFDVCPANSVLNALAGLLGRPYDDGGALAGGGRRDQLLLDELNGLAYYLEAPPKSLANSFAGLSVMPVLERYALSVQGRLSTYCAHIAAQVRRAVERLTEEDGARGHRMLVTGGGAFNTFLVGLLKEALAPLGVGVVIPDAELVKFKEALIMGLLGVLRWRENATTLASVTGARRDGVGGALWMGQEA